MNLKEAFRYQNKLNDIIMTVSNFLESQENIMKTTVEHLRKKANASAENEKVDSTRERKYTYEPNDMIDLLEALIMEKEILYSAIGTAKRGLNFDMDSQIDLNMKRQNASRLLRKMGNISSVELIDRGKGRDYTFNQEGNQTSYCYDLKTVSVIDFDRDKVKHLANRLITVADEASAKIDQILVNTQVEYHPFFGINESFEEVFEAFRIQSVAKA